ncbi:MAG: CoA transferase [Chloroflexota bacterium]|nr:CoA transferase [Chloroflexota bacterium]
MRVLDVATFIAAPFCATLLSEFGADVIKVEEPSQGDSLRRLAEQYKGEGLWWLQESRNKRTVTCDLRVPEGQDLFRRLAAHSDVIVENFRPGTMEGWHIGYDDLAKVNPGVIMMRISGYGQTGPFAKKPGFGRVAQAFGGLTYLAGFPDRPPVVPGSATIADYAAGLFGAFAVLVAKEYRDKTGEGQQIDISLYESMFRIMDTLAIVYDKLGVVRERTAFDAPHAAPHSHYGTNDGKWVAVATTNDKLFARLCDAMERPELVDDPRFRTVRDRVAHRREIDEIVSSFTTSHDLQPLMGLLDEHEIPASPIYSVVEIFADPQYKARESIVAVEDERYGTLRMPGVVPKMSRSPGVIRHAGRALGADTDDVYRTLLGMTDVEIADLKRKKVI